MKSRNPDIYSHLPLKSASRHELRRRSFDSVAELYDEARPTYPEQLFKDLVKLSGIAPGGRILEIGPGTGQATLPLARLGFSILALELGRNLAALAARKLQDYPKVEIRHTAFEDWPVERAGFDLVLAATAFHWIRPVVGFSRAAAALKSQGSIALIWNFGDPSDDEFQRNLRKLYRRFAPGVETPHPPEARIRRQAEKITGSGHFERALVRRYPWQREYNADEYINHLKTTSNHILLDSVTRRNLYRAMRALIAKQGGKAVRRSVAVLFLARKRESPAAR